MRRDGHQAHYSKAPRLEISEHLLLPFLNVGHNECVLCIVSGSNARKLLFARESLPSSLELKRSSLLLLLLLLFFGDISFSTLFPILLLLLPLHLVVCLVANFNQLSLTLSGRSRF